MRIAVVSTPFVRVPPEGYGGTELFLFELVERLAARGHDVTLFATGDSRVTCRLRSLYRRPEWPPTAADELNHAAWALAHVAKRGFDVVHVNSPLAIPLLRFVDVPAVATLHQAREPAPSRIFAIHPEVHYVAISQRQLDLEVPLPRARVIHHGLTIGRYPPSDTDQGYLLHLGRYCEEKGTHTAIDAARMAGMPLVLAGRIHSHDRAWFAREVEPRLAASPSVTDVGEATHARKLELLRGARAVVCPLAWEEPFGLVAIEAMLCGTPVIGFPHGSFPEIVDEGVTGMLAPDGDVEALAGLIGRASEIDRVRCARRARERFDAELMADRYERALSDAAHGHIERAA